MAIVWGAPRRAYELARDVAAGDRTAQDGLWKALASQDQADIVLALGAQARYAARSARTVHGVPILVSAGTWNRIACADIRAFTIDAWVGSRPALVPDDPCEDCLRAAAEVLAELHLTALAAMGIPRSMLAEVCARAAANARESGPHSYGA